MFLKGGVRIAINFDFFGMAGAIHGSGEKGKHFFHPKMEGK
jgi:hypothetical protein